jgi:hypothetical protein
MAVILFATTYHRHPKKAMAPKITDPNTFLRPLVSKRGKSDLYGVYLTGVNVIAESTEDYDYGVNSETIERDLSSLIAREETDWNRLLVETRRDEEQLIFPISFIRGHEPYTVFFANEGHEMSCMVFIPTLVVSEFVTEVTFFQHLLKFVARFAGKTPTTIRFTLGAVFIEWDEMVSQGYAEEVEVGW